MALCQRTHRAAHLCKCLLWCQHFASQVATKQLAMQTLKQHGAWLTALHVTRCRRNVDSANAINMPNQLWRDRVLYMAYSEVALFAVICLVTVVQAMDKMCGGDKKKNEYSKV
jgi:hypothetical protein